MKVKTSQELWEAALGELQMQVSKANYRTWLEKTFGLAFQDGQFVVGVPNTFVAEYLDKNQRSLIEKTLSNITHRDTTVQFRVDSLPGGSGGNNGEHPDNHRASLMHPLSLNTKYSFSSFVVGSCNRLAFAAATSVADNPGQGYNPLFVYGGAGLGKTHLLQAIGHSAAANNLTVIYASAERFTNEFIHAIRQRKTEEFNNRYRGVDILLIDDIHFISGKEQTEESFFHTFNELHNANHQIVITSDCPPTSMPLLENRLLSRFEWGLIVDIQPPDWETRLAILQAKAEQSGIIIPAEVLEFIAGQKQDNVRQLEGSLNRVIAFSTLVRAEPTIDLAMQALEDIATRKPILHSISPTKVIDLVASSFKLSSADLISRKRDRETALGRQVAMYLLREKTNCSLEQIGKELGGRDHSTVIHACDKISAGLRDSSPLKRRVTALMRQLT
ncbi:chromosomal replication initiator protein DnaA [Chloroflexota bacterium]